MEEKKENRRKWEEKGDNAGLSNKKRKAWRPDGSGNAAAMYAANAGKKAKIKDIVTRNRCAPMLSTLSVSIMCC